MTIARVVKLDVDSYLLSKLREAAKRNDISTTPASDLQRVIQFQLVGLFMPAPFQE